MNRSQRIAIWVLVLVGLLVTWKLFGQGFGGFRSDQPFLARNYLPASSQDQVQTNLAYRWVFSDMATNTTITTWTDRVYGLQLLNGNPVWSPTNSSLGVHITQDHWLTNQAMMISSNVAFGLIILFEDSSPGSIYPGLIMNGYPADLQYNFGYDFYTTDGNDGALALQRNSGFTALGPTPYRITNQWHTLIFTQTVTNDGTSGFKCYTNGVLSFHGEAAWLGHGWGGQSLNGYPMPIVLGRNLSRNAGVQAFIREYWVWTNNAPGDAVGKDLSSVTISNFHFYATNTYQFSP